MISHHTIIKNTYGQTLSTEENISKTRILHLR